MESIYLDEDQILIQKIREEGDEKSFNILYNKYWAETYTNSLYLLKDHEQAQDVTQGIFTSLWLNRQKLHINNLKAYLHASVRNRVLRIFEAKKRFVPFEELINTPVNPLKGESADFLTLKHEFLHAYKDLLDSLPPQRKKIFGYYFDEGLTTEEIANQLSLSRKTVQNQLGRAVSFLKTTLSHLSTMLFILH